VLHGEGIADPIKLSRLLWPKVRFPNYQRGIIYSLRDNDETYVVAANQVGKDFVAAFVTICEFLCHRVARIVTTSVRDDHLRVLWGEMGRFISDADIPLTADKGGPLLVTHREIRKVYTQGPKKGQTDPISYIRGMTCDRPEGLAGHHAPYTLAVIDEASGVDNSVYDQMRTWAKRMLIFGNPNPCVQGIAHFFYRAVEEGDIAAPEPLNGHMAG
jgi:hypothetical protein